MSNHVTHETALALKAAGFPQPEPTFGQIWYDELGEPAVCASGRFIDDDGKVWMPEQLGAMAFAPAIQTCGYRTTRR